jgi:DNA-binding NtrC family response regulator
VVNSTALRDITVLLVDPDRAYRTAVGRQLSANRFRTICIDGMSPALQALEKADILITDAVLPNGDSEVLIEQWHKRDRGSGPLCITGTDIDLERSEELLSKAWNVLPKPYQAETIVALATRYATVIRGTDCCREVSVLRRRVNVLTLVVATLGGTQVVVPLIRQLISSIP